MTGKRKPVIREYTVESSRVTDTVRLILLADYHDSDYGAEQELLVDRVAELSPDAVLMAGDMADCLRSHERVQQLTEWLASRYPCYAVSGNHELRTGEWDRLRDAFRSRGVTVLQGQTDELTVRGQRLCIGGLDDCRVGEKEWNRQLASCRKKRRSDCFSVLLSHRPHLVAEYRSSGYELICCGHAHGGQIRLPGLINGLYAPDQGLFPRYAGGVYSLERCTLVVSRGLALNALPRFGNPPELVLLRITPGNG